MTQSLPTNTDILATTLILVRGLKLDTAELRIVNLDTCHDLNPRKGTETH